MKAATTIKTRSAVKENVGAELNRVGINAIGITSAAIGCWAVACLASGMINSDGPVNLVSNFVAAFIG